MALDYEKIETILSRGNDVVIKRKKRDGKLVDVIYEQSLKIQEIVEVVPAERKKTRDRLQEGEGEVNRGA